MEIFHYFFITSYCIDQLESIIDWGEIVDSMCAGHNKGTYAVNDDGEEIWLFTDGMNYSFSDWPEKFSSVKNTLIRFFEQLIRIQTSK